jgi:glycolate oxidase
LSGGAVPARGGLVLSLEKMNRVKNVDPANLTITVEPGVITNDLQLAAEAHGLFFPGNPASSTLCSIGGNLGECAGGLNAVKYGVTRDYICGMEAVLASGAVIRLGGQQAKNVTGYDLIRLIIGSEGTLAIATEITLKILPLPAVRVDLLAPFDTVAAACEAVSGIFKARIIPASLELMDRTVIELREKVEERKFPFSGAGAVLFIEVDGQHQEAVEKEYERIGEICLAAGAKDVGVAETRPDRERYTAFRKGIREAIQAVSPKFTGHDVVVPRTKMPEMFHSVAQISAKYGIAIVGFGHAGDGNIHFNAMKNDVSDQIWAENMPQVTEAILKAAVALGGTLTGEHGVGLTRKKYLGLALDPAAIEMMKGIKKVFDPDDILNPGKIFPETGDGG